jgi:hypothetical protein
MDLRDNDLVDVYWTEVYGGFTQYYDTKALGI